MELYLLRHADAGDPQKWSEPDAARPLSRKGRRQAERLGAFLASVGFKPDVIVTSPKVRALETAEIVGQALKVAVTERELLAYGLGIAQLAALLEDLDVTAPMLVGHDPDFSDLLATLCAASGLTMKKGALARIDMRLPAVPGSGMLRWLIPPDLLDPS